MSEPTYIQNVPTNELNIKTTDSGIQVLLKHKDQQLIDLESYSALPSRKKVVFSAQLLESFIDYVKRYEVPTSKIFVEASAASFVLNAIFDFPPEAGGNRWGWDRAVYSAPFSLQWKRWLHLHEKTIPQREFAEFIEQNAIDILEPAAAEMLEVATNLTVKTNAEFNAKIDLIHGSNSVSYTEAAESNGHGQGGRLTVPRRLLLAIAPFVGGPKYEVSALLRIRVVNNKLNFHLVLENLERVLENATEEIVEKVGKGVKSPIFRGEVTL